MAEQSAIGRLICADEELRMADSEVYGGINAWRSNVVGAEREVRNQSHGDSIRARRRAMRGGLSRIRIRRSKR